MPASSIASTSCQRFSRAEPGTLVCASSSTSTHCGCRCEDRVGVHLLQRRAAIVDLLARDDLQIAQLLLGALRACASRCSR